MEDTIGKLVDTLKETLEQSGLENITVIIGYTEKDSNAVNTVVSDCKPADLAYALLLAQKLI
jgi:hypothetical protein